MATETRAVPARPGGESDEPPARDAEDQAPPAATNDRRRDTRLAILSTTLVGIALSIAFFPAFFLNIGGGDDEGSFLLAMREFLKHGSLYVHTGSPYGPFYFTFVGFFYKITGQQPNLFNSRLWALAITAIEAGIFAAAVYRVTRSKLFAALCQVATFCTLVRAIGIVALHPAPVIVLLLAIVSYALASYSVQRRTSLIIIAGGAVAAIGLCKANVGVAAAAAVLVSFVVGNRKCAVFLQYLIWAGALALPFVVVYQRVSLPTIAIFASFISLALLATGAVLRTDKVSLSGRTIGTLVVAAVGVGIVSLIWPIATGTTPHAVLTGVIFSPLRQVDTLFIAAVFHFDWLAVVLAVLGVLAAVARRNASSPATLFGNKWLPHVALALASFWVFGLGLLAHFGEWVPVIVLVPALAWIASAPPAARLALRFLVPLAILQMLHAYPVAGAQRSWSTVTMFVPCAIGAAVGLGRVPFWTQTTPSARRGGMAVLCVVFVLLGGMWPYSGWKQYLKNTPLDLPGSALVRLKKSDVEELHRLTDEVKQNCDTFYSAPGFDSLYVWTKLDPPTGLLRNWPGAHTAAEQREIAADLDKAVASGKRLCIVRNDPRTPEWLASSYGKGALGKALAPYQRQVAKVGGYSVSVKGAATPQQKKAAAAQQKLAPTTTTTTTLFPTP